MVMACTWIIQEAGYQVGWWAGGLGRGPGSLFTCKEPPDWHSNAATPTRHGPSTPASLILLIGFGWHSGLPPCIQLQSDHAGLALHVIALALPFPVDVLVIYEDGQYAAELGTCSGSGFCPIGLVHRPATHRTRAETKIERNPGLSPMISSCKVRFSPALLATPVHRNKHGLGSP